MANLIIFELNLYAMMLLGWGLGEERGSYGGWREGGREEMSSGSKR